MSKNAPTQNLCTQLKFRVLDESDASTYRLLIYVEDLQDPEISVHLWDHKVYIEAIRREDSKLNPPRPLQTLSVNQPLPYNVHPDCVTAAFLPDLKAILIEAPKTSNLASMTTEMPTLDKSLGSGASTPGSDFGSRQSETSSHQFTKTLHEFVIQNYCLPVQEFMIKVKDVIDYYVKGPEKPPDPKNIFVNCGEPRGKAQSTPQGRRSSNPNDFEGIVPYENQLASARGVMQNATPPSWYLPQRPDTPIYPNDTAPIQSYTVQKQEEQHNSNTQIPSTPSSMQQASSVEERSTPSNK
uniref:Uncharacterized protein n=1 Tax=Trichuris muris TaxID=70415 RepID=A0A5S6QLV5_TRIMR